MQRDIVVKGRSLGGSSDLTLLAPIRPGFIDSLETMTYKTRVKRVLDALHGARQGAFEYHNARLLSDSVERVGAIQSVRVAVLEPQDQVMLAVSFDTSREAYIRVLWDKVGTLLDLIFCGTVDYVTAFDHTFEEWAEWARRVQVETGFFYGPSESTARDLIYLRRAERMNTREGGRPLNLLRARVPTAEEAMQRFFDPPLQLPADEAPVNYPSNYLTLTRERVQNGLQGLFALYRLADLHRPDTPDGEVLRHAAIDLLLEFVQLWEGGQIEDDIQEARGTRFARPLDWLFPNGVASPNRRPKPVDPATLPPVISNAVLKRIQGGIVRPYGVLTHGALLLLTVANAAVAARLCDWLAGHVTHGDSAQAGTPDSPHVNVALTFAGLRAFGLGEDQLELFPEEFRHGMAARAGLLGDVRNNHPRRWRRPLDADTGTVEIDPETAHVVLQLRCEATNGASPDVEWSTGHPLYNAAQNVLAANPGVVLISVQSLSRRYNADKRIQEHFGWADGNGQPEPEAGPENDDANRVHLGEIVNGHDNAADFANVADPRQAWLADGSFLVLRKYRQFPGRLEKAVAVTAQAMSAAFGGAPPDWLEVVYGKLMGRTRNGSPVADPARLNRFDYRNDPDGRVCPLRAHIRLAHPRSTLPAARPPRMMRRSMAYGPTYVPGSGDDGPERGLVFMAYVASIGEQYEVVQRWLNGGNSSGTSSGHSCPIVGVPDNGVPRVFRFEHEAAGQPAQEFSVALEGPTALLDEPDALTRLEWGLYLFAPSLAALDRLGRFARIAAAVVPALPSAAWSAARGRHQLAELRCPHASGRANTDAWRVALEDAQAIDRLEAADLWSAIRADHGGVLRSDYGVIVAAPELIEQVLLDRQGRYSLKGQFELMKQSVGEIYLGLDPGARYDDESGPVNAEIMQLPRGAAYGIAYTAAERKIKAIRDEAIEHAARFGETHWNLTFDVREVVDEVLADLCEAWFGIQGSPHFQRGSTDWQWRDDEPPIYPGHFTALSRWMFQPHPGPVPAELGRRYGQALTRAMTAFVADIRRNGPNEVPKEPGGGDALIAKAVFKHRTHGSDDAWVARTMVGVMMGFIAPIIGAVLNVVREWQRERRFDALRADVRAGAQTDLAAAERILGRAAYAAARMRPMPQIIWRTALVPHRLGPSAHAVDVKEGDIVVLGLVSGTQQCLADGVKDGSLMFGGKRTATPGQHPTHACPGRTSGFEALLGTLCALLGPAEQMRQIGTPLGLSMEGLVDNDRIAMFDKGLAGEMSLSLREPPPDHPPAPLPARVGQVLCFGDSWVSNPYPLVGKDIRDMFKACGYDAPEDFCDYRRYGFITDLERVSEDMAAFVSRRFKPPVSPIPKAIVLSGGGNDSTKSKFAALLVPNDQNPATPILDPTKLATLVGKIETSYRNVLNRLLKELSKIKVDVPVILHGYDHFFPQGVLDANWFRKPLNTAGYKRSVDHVKEDQACHDLIEALNKMLADLAQEPQYRRLVRHVPLQGTITRLWNNPTDGWRDDLHPHNSAFQAYALAIDAVIEAFP